MATATKPRAAKAPAPTTSVAVGDATLGRSGLLVDAVEDVLPATRSQIYGAKPVIEVSVEAEGIRLTGRANIALQVERFLPSITHGEGKVSVNSEELAKSLRTLRHEPITLVAGKSTLTIVGSARIELSGQAATIEKEVKTKPIGEFEPGELLEVWGRILHATSSDEARPVLECVSLRPGPQGCGVQATDSYRAITGTIGFADTRVASQRADGETTYLVEKESVSYMLRRFKRWGGPVRFSIHPSWASFEFSDRWSGGFAKVTTRIAQGEFPNLQQLIESAPVRGVAVIGDYRAFADQSRAAYDLAGQGNPLEIVFGDAVTLKVKGEAGTTIEATVPGASYEGAPRSVMVNGSFLAEMAAFSAGASFLKIEVAEDERKPLRATGAGGFVYLLMPVSRPSVKAVPKAQPKKEAEEPAA